MAIDSSSNDRGAPISPTTILAVLTALGAIVAASHRLSSDRPVASPGKPNEEISEQMIDTYLWEDPFAALQKDLTNRLGNLVKELAQKSNDSMRALQILPVLIPGGPSSEDREQRLRSRFAVVSALAESGYAPENPQHIGIAQMSWPSTLDLKTFSNLSFCAYQTNPMTTRAGSKGNLTYSFEWYVQEPFVRHSAKLQTNNPVLVLWLDEDAFDDYPIKRLDQFLQTVLPNSHDDPPKITIIGPSLSSTLRAIFPGEFDINSKPNSARALDPPVYLTNASLFLAAPRAIDEVLIQTNADSYSPSRSALISRLTQFFRSAKNFTVTDSDLAQEVLIELQRRGIDLTRTNQDHLVLLADWDNFFGRMVSAAYAAEMVYNQTHGVSRPAFLEKYRSGLVSGPTNLHTFLYLSGLDGQALYQSAPRSGDDRPRPRDEGVAQNSRTSWQPDVNKAEGAAQLDYLGRLADRISNLEQQLQREKQGTVRAIGIAGGDIYDTLLILQALRPRFPNAVFFTSTLDARFWDPKELPWTRNLLVVTGYGLELRQELQGDVPPFRSSSQTAQFAATLAALGNPELGALTNLPVRCFEIGRSGPVDLPASTEPQSTFPHPVAQPAQNLWDWFPKDHHMPLLLLALVSALLLAAFLSTYFRRLTFERFQFLAEPLWLADEDLGGLEGFLIFSKGFQQLKTDSPKGQWLQGRLRSIIEETLASVDNSGNTERLLAIAQLKNLLLFDPKDTPTAGSPISLDQPQDRAIVQSVLRDFLDVWNRILPVPIPTPPTSPSSAFEAAAVAWPPSLVTNPQQLDFLQTSRRDADRLIEQILGPKPPIHPKSEDTFTAEWAAKAARQVSWKLHELHTLRLAFARGSTFSLGLIAILLLIFSLTDASGGFFSLSGTSVWPTTWLCFLVVVLSVVFLTESYFRLRTTVLATTRCCRLDYDDREFSESSLRPEVSWRIFRRATAAGRRWLRSIGLPPSFQPLALVEASRAWSAYQQKGHGRRRILRSLGLSLAYLVLISVVFFLFSGPTAPVPIRGTPARLWYNGVMLTAFALVLFLSFWTIDAACLCRWFIQCISRGPTLYPLSARQHFSRVCGNVPGHILADWIDVRIIAEITERVGRLIYFPVIAFSLLLLAHHRVFYNWPWMTFGYVIAVCNLAVAGTSIVILQQSARRARDISANSFEEKLHELKAAADVTPKDTEKRSIDEAERLLSEIKGLNTGAFAGFWGNPVVGAFLLPTGGAVLIELVRQYSSR